MFSDRLPRIANISDPTERSLGRRKWRRCAPPREALIHCASRPGEGSPSSFGGDKPLKLGRCERRATQ
jgi:hypothetical protein